MNITGRLRVLTEGSLNQNQKEVLKVSSLRVGMGSHFPAEQAAGGGQGQLTSPALQP